VPAQNSKTTENLEFCDLWPYRRGHAHDRTAATRNSRGFLNVSEF